jgi:hypothetical protein
MLCRVCSAEIGNASDCPNCAILTAASLGASVPPSPVAAQIDSQQSANASANQASAIPGGAGSNEKTPDVIRSIENQAEQIKIKKQKVVNKVTELAAVYFSELDQDRRIDAPFTQVTRRLTARAPVSHEFILRDLDEHFSCLNRQHLILIECAEHEFALDAAHALISKLHIGKEDKREIDLRQQIDKKFRIGVKSFLPENSENEQRDKAILVYAPEQSAQSVLDVLIGDPFKSRSFESQLIDSRVYVLCIVQSGYIDERLSDPTRELRSPFWKIPFLEPMLKEAFPDDVLQLEKRILHQRIVGRWDQDESKFHREMKSYLKRGELRQLIDERDKPVDVEFAKKIFRDDDYISKTILYSATYFRDLGSRQFCDLVESLFGDRNVTVPSENYDKEPNQPRTEVPAKQFWSDDKDKFLWEHLRESASGEDASKVIDFSDYRSRDSLKAFLESSRSLYIRDNFRAIHDQGFLFYPSDRMAQNVIRLTLDMIASYPDEFNKEWLVELIIRVRENSEVTRDLSGQPMANVFESLRRRTPDASALVYSRIAELLRRLLKEPGMKATVDGSFADLIRLGWFDSALELIKRLKTVPEIDEFYWMRQMLDQGDKQVRRSTYDYFYKRVRSQGASILDAQEVLEEWLPKDGRSADRYSRSSAYALRSLIQYCVDAVEQLSPESYGVWPSPYPLFASFESVDACERGLNRMITWLFHPAMSRALIQLNEDFEIAGDPEEPTALIGALITEWFFILLGPRTKTPTLASREPGFLSDNAEDKPVVQEDSKLDAATLVRIILEQTARIADKDQRRDLIYYWQLLREDITYSIKFDEWSADQRALLVWKNNRLWDLLKAFRTQLQTAASSSVKTFP